MLYEGGFTFTNFLVNVFAVFMFFIWIWLLITIFNDLLSRHDISAFGKVIWVIALIVLPYIGIFAYILTQSHGMADRRDANIKHTQNEIRKLAGFSPADEIEKLGRLKASGDISAVEYDRLRARFVQ